MGDEVEEAENNEGEEEWRKWVLKYSTRKKHFKRGERNPLRNIHVVGRDHARIRRSCCANESRTWDKRHSWLSWHICYL